MSVFDVFNPLQYVTPRFTEEKLQETLQWFDENAKPQLILNEGEPINVVTIEKLLIFLGLKKFHKRTFHYPSLHEVMLEVEKLKADVFKVLTKEQFIYILNLWVLEPDLKRELKLAFQVFDTAEKKYLEINEFSTIVKEYGDVFTEDEVCEFIRDAHSLTTGIIYYEEFIETMFRTAPELHEVEANYLYDDPNDEPQDKEPVIDEPTELAK